PASYLTAPPRVAGASVAPRLSQFTRIAAKPTPIRAAPATASSTKWLPVTSVASTTIAGYAIAKTRERRHTPTPTPTAQPACSDGIAASGSVTRPTDTCASDATVS